MAVMATQRKHWIEKGVMVTRRRCTHCPGCEEENCGRGETTYFNVRFKRACLVCNSEGVALGSRMSGEMALRSLYVLCWERRAKRGKRAPKMVNEQSEGKPCCNNRRVGVTLAPLGMKALRVHLGL